MQSRQAPPNFQMPNNSFATVRNSGPIGQQNNFSPGALVPIIHVLVDLIAHTHTAHCPPPKEFDDENDQQKK
jgi:hypothetical protein